MITSMFSKEEFKQQPEEFRIGAIISDGMWYSLPKWRKLAKVSEQSINDWIQRELATGRLVQAETGAKSYRFPLKSIEEWYKENNIEQGTQIIDFLFPPRIWAGLTETEGFLNAPLREIGIVSFYSSSKVAKDITERLRGIARVREAAPGQYKAYCLDSVYVRSIVEKAFEDYKEYELGKIYSRAVTKKGKRRELVDFPEEYRQGIVLFYKAFGRSLVKGAMDTINIFLPDPEDQETQIIMWVIAAIEKFDESSAVPFSGYLNSVLKRWPYDLPANQLGKDLDVFQRKRSRAINALREKTDKKEFTHSQIAEEMGIGLADFMALEEKHKIWISAKTATTLTWSENSEEKMVDQNVVSPTAIRPKANSDVEVANNLSTAIITTALETEQFEDAFSIMSQVDSEDLNIAKIQEVSKEFIQALGITLGLNDEKTN